MYFFKSFHNYYSLWLMLRFRFTLQVLGLQVTTDMPGLMQFK